MSLQMCMILCAGVPQPDLQALVAAFGHREFEVSSSPEKPSELRDRLENLAYYVLENGPVFNDGDTVGSDEFEKIAISHAPSSFGHEGEVILLTFPVQRKKRFFGLFG